MISLCNVYKIQVIAFIGFMLIGLVIHILIGLNDPTDLNYVIAQTEPGKKLEQVLIVFRHGMRSPAKLFSYDRYKNGLYWPEGLGQLTKEGKLQLFEMGRKLRWRYSTFLIPYNQVTSKDVKAVTTKFDRCYQSAALILAGLYPPMDFQIWNNDLLWHPVPISFDSPDKVYIIKHKEICPRFWHELLSQNVSSLSLELLDHFRKYVEPGELKQHFDLFMFCDTINAEVKLRLPQPIWIEDVYPKIQAFLKHGLTLVADNIITRRLFIGSLVTDILFQINKTVHNEDSSKIYLYSGHDTSVHSLMYSLGFSPDFHPDYGSAVIFELYSDVDNYYIKILYNQNVSFTGIEVKTLPNCETLCPLNKFTDIVKPLIVTDWEKECKTY